MCGVKAGIWHPADDDVRVGLHLVGESEITARLTYSVSRRAYGRIRAEIVSKRYSGNVELPLSQLTEGTVRRHIELLLEASRGESIDYVEAWGVR